MSLSTSVGGGMGSVGAGGAGMAMAAHAAQGQVAQPIMTAQPPPGANIPGGGGVLPPPSLAAFGADLLDKTQLSKSAVKSVAHLPLVAVDVAASKSAIVASFPPKPTGEHVDDSLQPKLVGKVRMDLHLKKGESSHKTLRKYLTNDRGYDALARDTLASPPPATQAGDNKGNDKSTMLVSQAHQLLGYRRLTEVPDFIKQRSVNRFVDNNDSSTGKSTALISEDETTTVSRSNVATVTNGTMDGVSVPTGTDQDMDRVVLKVKLAETKKAITMLPEEVTRLNLAVAQLAVDRQNPKEIGKDDSQSDDPFRYPLAIALPTWQCHDNSLEAWMDAVNDGAGSGVFVQRSVAALAGALLPDLAKKSTSLLESYMVQSTQLMQKRHQQKNDGTNFHYDPMVVMVGIAEDGVECTAVEVSQLQKNFVSARYGSFRVLSNVAHPLTKTTENNDVTSRTEACLKDLFLTLDEGFPESEAPVAVCLYGGTKKEQEAIATKWTDVREDLETWEKVPVMTTPIETVALGTATLGGVAHGRLMRFDKPTKEGAKRPIVSLAIRVENVSSCAVGLDISYTNGKTWEKETKTIFDFDRRVPAGPLDMKFNAAEICAKVELAAAAAAEKGEGKDADDELMLKTIAKYEGKKGIAQREAAAMKYRLQIVQRHTRDGPWIKIGNSFRPLTKEVEDKEATKKQKKLDDDNIPVKDVAIEEVTMKLSLGATGIISFQLEGDFETVAQATVTQRNSRIRYWLLILAAILFFGGFLVRSYWESHVQKRDTIKLLAYYKHVLPGSLHDGDEHGAAWIVYKYRHNKAALWKKLERKYGFAVLEADEWPETDAEDSDEEEQDLDASPDDNEGEEKSEQGSTEEEL